MSGASGAAGRNAVLAALATLILFASLRYDGFLTAYNITTVLSYNSMFALIALGMMFVIVTGGIDLSVGAVAALGSVAAAYASQWGLAAGLGGGVGAGLAIGLLNGALVARLGLAPFIVTLATMLAARGMALLFSGARSVPISTTTDFMQFGLARLWGVPYPPLAALVLFLLGALVLNRTAFGRTALAIGGNPEAARLMGLPVRSTLLGVYAISGGLAGLAGATLAAQGYAGQPTEGVGWELLAIASVVVGGTLLTGGAGSALGTLYGVLLLGLIFNILNFENGRGWITLSAYWQSVVRGALLLAVIMLQSALVRRGGRAPGT